MQIVSENSDTKAICKDTLSQGGVVAHATDTCFGLAVDISNAEAVAKVAKIKQMSEQKPMSILVADEQMLREYGEVNERAEQLIHKHLPGALTLILPKTDKVPAHYFPELDAIGLRIPNIPWFLEIIKDCGTPVTTTSANITGNKEPYSAQEVFEIFKGQEYQPDIIIDKSEGDERNKPSTIVKVVGEDIEIVRQGEITIT